MCFLFDHLVAHFDSRTPHCNLPELSSAPENQKGTWFQVNSLDPDCLSEGVTNFLTLSVYIYTE